MESKASGGDATAVRDAATDGTDSTRGMAAGAELGPDNTRSKNWCFTWNHYSAENIAEIKATWTAPSGLNFRCVMFEEEVAPTTGTPHLQGFFVAHSDKSFKQLRALLPAGIHIERMKGRIDQNVKYCSKDKTGVVLIGTLPESAKDKGKHGVGQGHRGIESKENDTWRNYIADVAAGMPWKDLTIKYAYMAGMYTKGFTELYELHRPKLQFDLRKRHGTLYPWQVEFLALIDAGADARSVYWIWSDAGNVGKTDATKHLVSVAGFTPIGNGVTRDMSCAWKGTHTVIDIARSEDDVNYAFIEKAKDGMVFSSKYESRTKIAENGENCFVVCFANVPPKVDRLSADRWRIYRINPDKTWTRGRAEMNGIWYEH